MQEVQVQYGIINSLNCKFDAGDTTLSSVIYRSIAFPTISEEDMCEEENWIGFPLRVVFDNKSFPDPLSWVVQVGIPNEVMRDAMQVPITVEMCYFHKSTYREKQISDCVKTIIPIESTGKIISPKGEVLMEVHIACENLYNGVNLQFNPEEVIAECGYRHLVNEEGEERKDLAIIFIDRKKS